MLWRSKSFTNTLFPFTVMKLNIVSTILVLSGMAFFLPYPLTSNRSILKWELAAAPISLFYPYHLLKTKLAIQTTWRTMHFDETASLLQSKYKFCFFSVLNKWLESLVFPTPAIDSFISFNSSNRKNRNFSPIKRFVFTFRSPSKC